MRQIDRASDWWREHRDKAPRAFDEDIDAAFKLLRSSPRAGISVRARQEGIRALWLERIGYFVHYRERPNNLIEIVAIWHASRDSRPKL